MADRHGTAAITGVVLGCVDENPAAIERNDATCKRWKTAAKESGWERSTTNSDPIIDTTWKFAKLTTKLILK